MKRIIIFAIVFCLLGFSSQIFANCTSVYNPPQGTNLPVTINSVSYDSYLATCHDNWWYYIYFHSNSNFYVMPSTANGPDGYRFRSSLGSAIYTTYINGSVFGNPSFSTKPTNWELFTSLQDGDYESSQDLYDQSHETVLFPNTFPRQLTISRDPEAGGGVASLLEEETEPDCEAEDGLFCGVCGYNYCVGEVPYSSEVKLGAFPNSGYAFAYWEWNDGGSSSTANPEIFTVTSGLDAVAVFERLLKWPLSGTPWGRTILMGFGVDWLEYCGGEITKHAGIDISATENETVYAVESGIVKAAQLDQTWGGWVTLEHNSSNNPYTTAYIHMIPAVSVNDSVDKGDPIGTVVNYGGPIHLHFGLRHGAYSNTSNRGRLPQSVCGGDPAFPENFENPSNFHFE